ncbi:MBL fold metallo-hydrolase [Babesia caballi]|uniref:MBL fold metallo-hydrolase n=1 Tax=Babesia caballi TaxID=5871 RepID=A0AAV4M1D9_BABCB|nr:MBL fold metallo-hydrolase [Babesia caballi]
MKVRYRRCGRLKALNVGVLVLILVGVAELHIFDALIPNLGHRHLELGVELVEDALGKRPDEGHVDHFGGDRGLHGLRHPLLEDGQQVLDDGDDTTLDQLLSLVLGTLLKEDGVLALVLLDHLLDVSDDDVDELVSTVGQVLPDNLAELCMFMMGYV